MIVLHQAGGVLIREIYLIQPYNCQPLCLHPQIFETLRPDRKGKKNEIQLTDILPQLVKEQAMYGLQFDCVRYDIGNKLDFIKTNLIYWLEHEEIGPKLKEWLLEYTSEMK
ncbi:MAG TPA: hypothetical protein VFG54_04640 [Prolixibacteraceae bacterium]|nr:hypothetical protein [Prolixibacteraceae bacterium]